MIAHFAEALPIKKLVKAEKIIKRITNGINPILMLCSHAAPLIASNSPKLLHRNHATNWAAKHSRPFQQKPFTFV